VKPVHLNGHIDYSKCCADGPNDETERSLAFPVGLAITSKRDWRGRLTDSQDLYVAALGSDKVAVLDTNRIEQAPGGLMQDRRDHIEVPGGPVGLELDESRGLVYVLARFTNELVVIDTGTRSVTQRHAMFSPEPASIVDGRHFPLRRSPHLEPRRYGLRQLPQLRRLRRALVGSRRAERP